VGQHATVLLLLGCTDEDRKERNMKFRVKFEVRYTAEITVEAPNELRAGDAVEDMDPDEASCGYDGVTIKDKKIVLMDCDEVGA
jgi:hypothetical protein